MAKLPLGQNRAGVIIALMVTGFGIGWLAGLSVSPVISIVIASVTGSVATIVAALSGVKEELTDPKTSSVTLRDLLRAVTPVPLAWLVAGLIGGASMGVWARTHDWLGRGPLADVQAELQFWHEEAGLDDPAIARRLFEHRYGTRGWTGTDNDLNSEIVRWVAATGLEQSTIAQRMFESSYSLSADNAGVKPVSAGNESDASKQGVLFVVSASDCADLQNKQGNTLRNEMLTAAAPQIAQIAAIITDTVVLQRIVEETLCVGG